MRNLLTTKLHLPEPSGDIAQRSRLLAQLDRGLDKKLTLVCAPAGFGKTTLVALWLRSLLRDGGPDRAPVQVAWYTIDEQDNDLATFLNYFVTAIRGAAALSGWVALDLRPGIPEPEALADELAHACEDLPGRLVIALDDYHFITDHAVQRLVSHLLRRLPAAVHVVITARSDPPLGLPQLRARNQVSELRTRHLAFSLDEAADFFHTALAAAVEPDIVAALWERTEGWAVGLRLAAISLSAAPDPARFIGSFQQHSSRHIIDYLVDEVLASQPPEIGDFLLRTSILDRFSGELCAAVLGMAPRAGQAMLAHLERNNLFLVPLDDHDEWYRFHSQLRTMLRNRLHTQAAGAEVAALHGRAAAWLAQQDLITEALPHYLAAGDPAGAAELIERRIPDMLNRERWQRLAAWLALLPQPLIDQRPALLLLRAWLILQDARDHQLASLVDQAERVLRSQPPAAGADALWGQIHALRCSMASDTTPPEETIARGSEALRLLPPHCAWARAFTLNIVARWQLANGQYPAARQMLEAEIAAAGPELTGYVVQLYHALAALHFFAGFIDDFYRVAARYEAAARQLDLPAPLKWAQVSLGRVHLERNEPEPALAYLRAALTQPELAHFHTLRLAAYALVELYAGQGRPAEAGEALAVLRRRLGSPPDAANLCEVEALDAYWALLSGDRAGAARWAGTAEQDPAVLDIPYRGEVLARIHLALAAPADLERATALVEALLAGYRRLNHVSQQVPLLVLAAQVYWQRRLPGPALAALRQALALGYPHGFRRAFTGAGPVIGQMLHMLAHERQFADAAGHLLAEMSRIADAAQPPRRQAPRAELIIEPLTEREAEILPLLAAGLSNKEISQRLRISPITVRNHTVNIYGKLQVKSRRQAADRARQLGLLLAPIIPATAHSTN